MGGGGGGAGAAVFYPRAKPFFFFLLFANRKLRYSFFTVWKPGYVLKKRKASFLVLYSEM